MVLTLMAYARLETYRNSQIFQILFAHYMEKDERAYLNLGIEAQYNSTKGAAKKEDNKPQPKINASPRISLALFLDKQKQAAQPDQLQQTTVLLKNLLHVLYHSQPFYEALIQENPHFPDELITSMINAIDALPRQNRPKKVEDLYNLTLSSPKLNEALYKIFHGAPEKYTEPAEKPPAEEVKEDKLEDTSQDTDILKAETEEPRTPKGYVSLADFITLSSSPQVRVYLASPQVLEAIFHNPHTVEEILAARKELHRQALQGADLKELDTIFKSRFEPHRDPAISSNLLNFQISKTDPQKYE